jgi:glycerol-3-phosphate O-acyltransferase / dihydroxyacetone phosphate acyltransferase
VTSSAEWVRARARYARPTSRVDRLVDRLADRLAEALYRNVEVRGDVPPVTGSELVLVNHGGGFSDPVVLIAAWPRLPRFVARDVIWAVPVAGRLMRAIRAVPVHRRQDGGPQDNTAAFLDVAAALAGGQSVAIFPEGDSIDEPGLHPLRTGAARMALAGLAAGARDLRVVPVGLHYRDKAGLRSSVLVQVAEPIRVADTVEQLRGRVSDDRELVRALTDEFAYRMRPVVPGYRTWDLARDLEDAADVALRAVGSNPLENPPYRDVVDVASRIAAGSADRCDEVAAAIRVYRDQLALIGLTDSEVAAGGTLVPRLRRRLGELAVALPFAVAGLPANVAGYAATTAVGRVPAAPATMATLKPLTATLAFPAGWVWWALRGRSSGVGAVAVRAFLAPAAVGAGVVAAERLGLATRVLVAWGRRHAAPVDALVHARRAVVAAVDAALTAAGATSGSVPPPE